MSQKEHQLVLNKVNIITAVGYKCNNYACQQFLMYWSWSIPISIIPFSTCICLKGLFFFFTCRCIHISGNPVQQLKREHLSCCYCCCCSRLWCPWASLWQNAGTLVKSPVKFSCTVWVGENLCNDWHLLMKVYLLLLVINVIFLGTTSWNSNRSSHILLRARWYVTDNSFFYESDNFYVI